MGFNVRMELNRDIQKQHGINDMGRVQKYIDSECIKQMQPYIPHLNGILAKSLTTHTVIGSGQLRQEQPYARYQYCGKLMVSPITGSAWAKKDEEKVLASPEVNLRYNRTGSSKAGPFWFERMKADHKDAILKGAQKLL